MGKKEHHKCKDCAFHRQHPPAPGTIMTEPQTIRDRSLSEPDAEVLVDVLLEGLLDVESCPLWPCSSCEYINSCMK